MNLLVTYAFLTAFQYEMLPENQIEVSQHNSSKSSLEFFHEFQLNFHSKSQKKEEAF